MPDLSCQTISKIGTQSFLLVESLFKTIQNPQASKNKPLDTALPFRETRFSSTHQNTGTSPSHQKTFKRYWCTPPTRARHHDLEKLWPSRLQIEAPKYSNLSKMKRQRNKQQVKEYSKSPQDQINEEDRGSLPGKEFRVMIVKKIQNLGNKMKVQINRMEARIKKIQKMFNKDLEKMENRQSAMNNTITEIKINWREAIAE